LNDLDLKDSGESSALSIATAGLFCNVYSYTTVHLFYFFSLYSKTFSVRFSLRLQVLASLFRIVILHSITYIVDLNN